MDFLLQVPAFVYAGVVITLFFLASSVYANDKLYLLEGSGRVPDITKWKLRQQLFYACAAMTSMAVLFVWLID